MLARRHAPTTPLFLDHLLAHGLVEMLARPVDSVHRCTKKSLGRILLADVLFRESGLGKLLDKQVVSGDQVLFREPRVVHEPVILKRVNNGQQQKEADHVKR